MSGAAANDLPEENLSVPKVFTLGIQHVLVMYAGAVAVPLIIGRALKLPPEQVAFLISADLFACGLATLVQSVGFPGVGIRLPVMMGVTFASVGPMLAMANSPDIGLLGIYGAVIAAGVFATIVAPLMSRLLPLFPPVVTGTIILVIGISLMRIGIGWAAGGLPTAPDYGFAPGPRHRAVRAPRDPGVDPLRQRLRRQRRGAARHRRGRRRGLRARRDAVQEGV
jgi:NCS2 family nucleobase:cation symporter-2